MDIATIIGIIAGIGLILMSILSNSGLDIFYNAPAFMIVFGGTFAATFIAFPFKEVFRLVDLTKKVFSTHKSDNYELIQEISKYAHKSKNLSIFELEKEIPYVENEFLRKGLLSIVDSIDDAIATNKMRQEIVVVQNTHKSGWQIFHEMGKFAPAFGMVGTLIGLVQMLSSLSDIDSIGPKMAVAMLTTFYGALLANIFFIPMSLKLKQRSADQVFEMNLIMEGVNAIRRGDHPKLIEEQLNIFLTNEERNESLKREIENSLLEEESLEGSLAE